MEEQSQPLTTIDSDFIEEGHSENQNIISLNLNSISILKKLRIKIFGFTFFAKYQLPGWEEAQNFYIFKCDKHGLQVTYPSDWKKKLICPKCYSEITKFT